MKNQVLLPGTYTFPLTGLTVMVVFAGLLICIVGGLFPWIEGFADAADVQWMWAVQPAIQTSQSSFVDQIFEAGSSTDHAMLGIKSILSFALTAVLAALLAFRPHQQLSHSKRDPFLVQTQMLLAVVGTALMIVVADSAARVFGIVALASLIRFRTNIRNPKEITVLLASLAVGLASGVGRWEIAIALTCFVLLLLWSLERFELSQISRAMEFDQIAIRFKGNSSGVRRVPTSLAPLRK